MISEFQTIFANWSNCYEVAFQQTDSISVVYQKKTSNMCLNHSLHKGPSSVNDKVSACDVRISLGNMEVLLYMQQSSPYSSVDESLESSVELMSGLKGLCIRWRSAFGEETTLFCSGCLSSHYIHKDVLCLPQVLIIL